jgi:hypothetical protein
MPTSDQARALAIIAALGVGLYVAWRIKRAAGAVADAAGAAIDTTVEVVTKDLNPASQENIIYGGVNNILETVTGDKNATLGGKLYDWLH